MARGLTELKLLTSHGKTICILRRREIADDRERRGLCRYCGLGDHRVNKCPSLNPACPAEIQSAATTRLTLSSARAAPYSSILLSTPLPTRQTRQTRGTRGTRPNPLTLLSRSTPNNTLTSNSLAMTCMQAHRYLLHLLPTFPTSFLSAIVF